MDRNIRHQQQMISTVTMSKRPPNNNNSQNMNQPNHQQNHQNHQTQRGDANSQHDELIKFIHDAWHKVSSEHGAGAPTYYKTPAGHRLHDFKPFDLESWWGRRLVQNLHISRGPQ